MSDDLFNLSLEWEGMDELMKALDHATEEVLDAAAQAVYEGATEVQKVAQELAPHDEGNLEASASTSRVSGTPRTEPEAEVGFNEPYALRMHEDQYNPGPITRQKPGVDGIPAGRKYLENAIKLRTKAVMNHITEKVRDALGSD